MHSKVSPDEGIRINDDLTITYPSNIATVTDETNNKKLMREYVIKEIQSKKDEIKILENELSRINDLINEDKKKQSDVIGINDIKPDNISDDPVINAVKLFLKKKFFNPIFADNDETVIILLKMIIQHCNNANVEKVKYLMPHATFSKEMDSKKTVFEYFFDKNVADIFKIVDFFF